jgi:TPR repeat protein
MNLSMSMKSTCVWLTTILFAAAVVPSRAQDRSGGGEVDVVTLQRLAEGGNSDAQFELGIRYLAGDGFAKDEKKAADWLQKSADQHNLAAMNAMGTLYEEGVGMPKDAKKAFEWYEQAAKYGFPLAQQNLAECYESGKGVEKNPAEALKWIERAAQQDFAPAQAAFAWKLEKGDGAAKNTREAAGWYLKAAQGGLVRAMTHLAYLYYTGIGVPLDYRRAEAWYRRAARSDDPWARNDIAWFLAVCPDENFHDGDTAVDYARAALEKMPDQDYQVVDTLAAALARSGQFVEAVQIQTKAIMLFGQDKSNEKQTAEEREKLEKELMERLDGYRKQRPFVEKLAAPPEEGTKPLIEDRILQEEVVPRKKPKTRPKEERAEGRSPVVIS